MVCQSKCGGGKGFERKHLAEKKSRFREMGENDQVSQEGHSALKSYLDGISSTVNSSFCETPELYAPALGLFEATNIVSSPKVILLKEQISDVVTGSAQDNSGAISKADVNDQAKIESVAENLLNLRVILF